MLLTNSREPIFNQAANEQLPQIPRHELAEYIDTCFRKTSKPINEDALNHLVAITNCHPQRTQQLAWKIWRSRGSHQTVSLSHVQRAWEELLLEPNGDVAIIEETLANGTESETTERKALYLLADHYGADLTSEALAERYGLGSHTSARAAMPRLRRRGLVEKYNGLWQIIDPLLAQWLRKNSPFADRAGQVTDTE